MKEGRGGKRGRKEEEVGRGCEWSSNEWEVKRPTTHLTALSFLLLGRRHLVLVRPPKKVSHQSRL